MLRSLLRVPGVMVRIMTHMAVAPGRWVIATMHAGSVVSYPSPRTYVGMPERLRTGSQGTAGLLWAKSSTIPFFG
jgi:hypothetical protein